VNVHGTDPNNADSDGDGLTDGDEVLVYGTHPLNPDTDNDGLTDGDEVNVHATDPLNPDSDGDGLTDGEEVNVHGTDPLNPDTDSDGMPDGWEVANGTDPKVYDADHNPDGDCNTNYEEYVAGTDPQDPFSFFAVIDIERTGNPLEIAITWTSVSGKSYAVYYCDADFGVPGNCWVLAEDMIPASGTGTNTWTDDGTLTVPPPEDVPERYYKIEVYKD
jgi:hypothetical protein